MAVISLNSTCLLHVSKVKEAEQEDAMQFKALAMSRPRGPGSETYATYFPLTMTIWEHLGSSEAYFMVYQLTRSRKTNLKSSQFPVSRLSMIIGIMKFGLMVTLAVQNVTELSTFTLFRLPAHSWDNLCSLILRGTEVVGVISLAAGKGNLWYLVVLES